MRTVETYTDGVLVGTRVVEGIDTPPSDAERLAAVEDAIDTLILDSLGGL